ncbi:high affinity immunoglobulin alpha and immunoglobulin mu Fc receptor [Tenrec ecaudatus]|uniref:high affinity immunoglobulin alpha and immunoglobulin mu Fc receptor n=1 Tax=Tenrec ecaudatus TaxID=94439 RepID=UPI003F59C6B1
MDEKKIFPGLFILMLIPPGMFEFIAAATANALKGPRLVSGEPGGAVTVTCHYAPTSVNRHQRKYWCRLGPPKWICRTIVSTNYYTHLRYHGRVTLEDFPRSSLFVVRLFQLSPTDEGCYRCGIGSRNDMLFFSVNLTVSTGLSSTVPTGTQAASELTRASLATTSPEANRWTSGTIQTGEGQRAGWDRVDPTPGTSETTASSKDRQPPEITMPVTPGTGSRVDVSVSATVPSPKFTVLSNTTDDIWVPGTRSSTANRAMVSEEGGRTMTPNTDGPIEETTSIRVALDATWKAVGTIRPSALTSKKWVWETFQEETSVSKPPALGDLEDATPAAGAWTFGTIIQEMATAEGSTKGDLVSTAEDSGLHATPSQATGVEPLRPRGTESSTER